MKVLVVGGGGREHALAWKLAQSPLAEEVLVAPGNAGTAAEPGVRNLPVAADDLDALLEAARGARAGLTVVGPETPLAAGLADRFEAAGLRVFGPTAAAARLESSKGYCKDFLRRHGIPTAAYRRVDSLAAAERHLRGRADGPVVVKADGLAAGKGVVVAADRAEALAAAAEMLSGDRLGAAGRTLVLEDFLAGEEASFICMADGEELLPLAGSRDHKARDDGGRGPNTGGMGAYSPTPLLDAALERRVLEEIVRPTLRGLAAEGVRYRGFLYAGLMLDAAGEPKVLEYNCRLGDPEAQPVLLRLRSDLLAACLAAGDGRLGEVALDWDPRPALGVVLAARGYPGTPETGAPIAGLEAAAAEPDVKVFHAGTARRGDSAVTAGGRVLCACALGADLGAARARAYRAAARIGFAGKFCRRDIGGAG